MKNAPLLKETWEQIVKDYNCPDTGVIDEEEAQELEAMVDRMVSEYLEFSNTNVSEDLEKIPFRVLVPETFYDENEDWRPSWVKFGEQCLQTLQEKESAKVFKPFSLVDVKDLYEMVDVSLARLNAEIEDIKRQEAVSLYWTEIT